MEKLAEGGFGAVASTPVPFKSIVQRDLDRQRFAAAKGARRARRDAQSHKNGFGTMRRSERFA